MPISATIEQVPWDSYIFTDTTTGDIIFRSITSNNFLFGFNENVPSTFNIKQGTGAFIAGTSNAPAQLTFQRARSNNTSLQTNDQIGSINFSGRVGVSTTSNFANISAFYTGTGTNKSGSITFNTESNFGMTERIRITDAGNLGVGTSAPTGIATLRTCRKTPRQLSFNNPTTINVWYDHNTLFSKYGTTPWFFETSNNIIVSNTFTTTTSGQTRTVSMSYNLNGVWTPVPSDGSILPFYPLSTPQGGAITVHELENSGSFSVIDRSGTHTTLCATSNGLVGISTSNPSYALDVSTPSNTIHLTRFGRLISSTYSFFQPVLNPTNSNVIQSICTIVNAKWGTPITIHFVGGQNESMTSIVTSFAPNYSMGSNWWRLSPQVHNSFSTISFLPRILVRGVNVNNNIEIAIAREEGTQVSASSNMWAMVQSFDNSTGLSFSNSSSNTYFIMNTDYNNIPFYRQTTLSNECFQAVGTNAIFTNGMVGIGRSNPGFALDINGDINFSGAFRQNGVPYVGSQWSNGVTNNVFIMGSNVGIGNTSPSKLLHVSGDVQIDCNLIMKNTKIITQGIKITKGINGDTPSTISSLVTEIPGYTWDSNITLSAASSCNITMTSTTRINASLGINKIPAFSLDVNGDINFNGTLLYNGQPYVGSQWTSSNSNIFITGSNVGIGTNNPDCALHVSGDVKFDSNLILGNSRLSLGGFMITRRTSNNTTNVTSVITQVPGYTWNSNIVIASATGCNIFLNAQSTRTSNMIIDTIINMTNNESYAAPSSNTNIGGLGDRIVLKSGSSSNHPYSIGLDTDALWMSVPTAAQYLWHVGGTPVMSLNSNLLTVTQDILAFGSVSDSNLKTNIVPIDMNNAQDKVMSLKPVHFKWKEDIFNESYRNRNDTGFIAQDIEPIIPEAIQEMPIGEKMYKTIKYERLLPYIVGLLQKQQLRIEYLEMELKNLTNNQ
jgi:hypothetical protein